jgi:hypothetical protein
LEPTETAFSARDDAYMVATNSLVTDFEVLLLTEDQDHYVPDYYGDGTGSPSESPILADTTVGWGP